MRSRVRITFVNGLFGVGVGLTTAVGTAIVLYIGVIHVQEGILTLGDLVLVMSYLAQLYIPIQLISKSVTGLQSALASAERAFGLLAEEPDVPEAKSATPRPRHWRHRVPECVVLIPGRRHRPRERVVRTRAGQQAWHLRRNGRWQDDPRKPAHALL